MSVENFQYVPILKGKAGEYGALQRVPHSLRGRFTPLIEIPPVPWNHATDQPAKTVDEHLEGVGEEFNRAWGTREYIFVDLLWIEDRRRLANRAHPLTYVFDDARANGVLAVPVTGLSRDVEYQSACREAVKRDGRGVCIRVQPDDFTDFDDLDTELAKLSFELMSRPPECDLVVDLKSVPPVIGQSYIDFVIGLLDSIKNAKSWRSLTLCGTAFPVDLIGLAPQQVSTIPRSEWVLWKRLATNSDLARIPSFGDYAIAHPQPPEVDPRVMRASASIRYTVDEAWLILKGRNLRDHGFTQFHDVAAALTHESAYCGPTFSWGDEYICSCAKRLVGTGNLTTWRRVGTSHHLAFAMHQLSNFRAA